MVERRPATPAEAKALANPLRLRILRLCIDGTHTNKELADRLGKDPATVLHHVRTLVDTGFLAPGEVRSGASGALEKPYRATGKSWEVNVGEDGGAAMTLAPIDALRDEVLEAGSDVTTQYRIGVSLSPERKAELVDRLQQIAEEYAFANDEGGEPLGLFVILHRRRP